jgi:hypothetical protein
MAFFVRYPTTWYIPPSMSVRMRVGNSLLPFQKFSNEHFSGQQQSSDGQSILQSDASHLGRIPAYRGFPLGRVGNDDSDLMLSLSSIRLSRMRSCSGLTFIAVPVECGGVGQCPAFQNCGAPIGGSTPPIVPKVCRDKLHFRA